MEEACHKHAITKCFEDKTLTPKDAHHPSASIWKNEEDVVKNKPFYSSVEWNVLASKTHDQKADYERGCRNEPCVDKNMCANIESNVECDDKYFLARNEKLQELL